MSTLLPHEHIHAPHSTILLLFIYIYINFTKLSWVVFDRFPQLRFDYTDPEKNFDRRRVHGLVCKLVQVKDTANATALEVTAGGKVSPHNLAVEYCWFVWFVNVHLLGWLVSWIWLCVNRTQGTRIPHTRSNVHGILLILVEFMSLVFTHMFYESCRRWEFRRWELP